MTKKAVIDWRVLDVLLQFKVTLKFCCHELGVAPRTLQRHITAVKGMTFEEYHELKLNKTGAKLQQKAIEMAIQGDRTMLIFCLKNLAGWSDKQEVSHTVGNNYEAEIKKLEENYEQRGSKTIEAEFKETRSEHQGPKDFDGRVENEQDGPEEVNSLQGETN